MDLMTCTIIKVWAGPREQNDLKRRKQGLSLFPIWWLNRMCSYYRHLLTCCLYFNADDLSNKDVSCSDMLKAELCLHPYTVTMDTFTHQRVLYKAMVWTFCSKVFLMISSYCISHALATTNMPTHAPLMYLKVSKQSHYTFLEEMCFIWFRLWLCITTHEVKNTYWW